MNPEISVPAAPNVSAATGILPVADGGTGTAGTGITYASNATVVLGTASTGAYIIQSAIGDNYYVVGTALASTAVAHTFSGGALSIVAATTSKYTTFKVNPPGITFTNHAATITALAGLGGIFASPTVTGDGSTVATEATGWQFNGPVPTSITFTTSVAVDLPTFVTNGTTGIGLRVAAPTGAGTNYAISTPSANNSFGGIIVGPTATNGSNPGISAAGTLQLQAGTGASFYVRTNGALGLQIDGSQITYAATLQIGGTIGTSATNNQFSTASQGAGTTAMYIGNAQITAVSDARLKDNIAPSTLDTGKVIDQFVFKEHSWADPSDKSATNRNSHGMIEANLMAQDVAQIASWLVSAPEIQCVDCASGFPCNDHFHADESGVSGAWRINNEYLLMVAVKEIQSLRARLKTAGIK